MSEVDPADCFKILVATDIHLGYNEKDVIRGNDSFVAFEEILRIGKVNEVDFILLGGDLFHDTNPSQSALQKCMKLLRQYTLGDKPIEMEFLSDQAINFQETGNVTVNYEDPNMNIAYPVFSIHGNHDDPCGFGGLSSLDLLATNGLVNYFGKTTDLTEIHIKPILIKKGTTQLALYGLSYIHDNRLARLFRDSKVIMEQPDDKSGDWFNIMVLHQNRAERGPKNYVPEEILPEFLDLVVWGHEHDCRIWPEEVPSKNFFVTQPGSSVATSLAEGESIDKHVGILQICGNQFKLDPIKLQTVRPFIFKSINLDDYEEELRLGEGDAVPKVQEFVSNTIAEMMDESKRKVNVECAEQPKVPLIRLRVIYTNEDHIFNAIRFGQQYNTRVANPSDMLVFKRITKRIKNEKKPIDDNAMNKVFNRQANDDDDIRLEDYVDQYFADPNNAENLQVMHSSSLSEMCRRLAEHDDDDAAKRILEFTKMKACQFLNEKMPEEDMVDDVLSEFRVKSDEIYHATLDMLSNRNFANSSTVVGEGNDDTAEKENRANFAQPSTRATAQAQATPNKRAGTSTITANVSARGRGKGTTSKAAAPSKAKATKGIKTELNISTSRKAQPTIQQSFSASQTRSSNRKKQVVYVIDSDESD